jgi:peptide/nickel transport system substrate-binding protein
MLAIVLLLAAESPLNRSVVAQASTILMFGTTDSVASSLDPANAYDLFGWNMLRSLGSGLVDLRVGTTGAAEDIVPDLATNWSVSSDGLQWTFTLRQGVKYDDGTEFNATDVKYTFDRDMGIADPNGAFVGIGFNNIIQNVTVIDTYTVRFNLKVSFGPFLPLIAGQECVMVDPNYAPMHGGSWNVSDVIFYKDGDPRASTPVALGPYSLANWTRVAGKDTAMKLVANHNYWNSSAGIPRTNTISIQFFSDSATLAIAIESGTVDVALRQLALTDIITMKSNPNLHVWQGAQGFIQYMCLQEKYAPFNETSVRQAVGAAINRTMLVYTVFQGQAQNLYSLIPNVLLGHSDAFQSLGDPNYTRTQELLAPFGYNATNKLAFSLYYETSGHYSQSPQQAQVLKASIEASGVIVVNLQGLNWPMYASARHGGTMQAFILGWYPDYVDPDDYTYPFLQSSGNSWLNINYSDSQMDQLVQWARANTSLSVRGALYGQVQNLTVADSPIIPLYQGLSFAVSRKGISGIYLDMSLEFHFQYVEAQSSTSVLCSPTTVSVGSPVNCTATVSGTNVTGYVVWSTSSVTGSFTSSNCTLLNGMCSTTYSDNRTGYETITANYGGDILNAPSSGSMAITVFINVSTGANVTVQPTNHLTLTFANVTVAGTVTANETPTVLAPTPPLNNPIGPYFDVKVTAGYAGNVSIGVVFDGSNMTQQQKSTLRMMQYTPLLADMSGATPGVPDGVVNMRDIAYIIAHFATTPNSTNWDPRCDIYGPIGTPDGVVNMRDIAFAVACFNQASFWVDITSYVDTTNNIVHGQTTHFSFIGIH